MLSDSAGEPPQLWTATEENDGSIYVRWCRGVRIEEQDARSLIDRVNELCADRPRPLLISMNEMLSLSPRSFAAFATELRTTRMALIGSTAVESLLCDFFTRVHHPSYPVQYFGSYQAAVEWLLGPGADQLPQR